MAKNNKETVSELQKNPDYIILNNPLASPKFIRLISKGKEVSINDVYTPKIFYEIASKLTPEHLINIQRNQSIVMEIQIKDFLGSIGANKKNYKHFIESVEVMQSNLLRWKEGENIVTTAIVTKSIHNPKTGKVEMYIDSDIARRILEVKEEGNFSFLKSNIFRLQNAQAIKLYPFFKSWLNHGQYKTDLERFKIQFGYNTSGYKYWSNLETKVLLPAFVEINGKTDIEVKYEPYGDALESQKPRIKGLIFIIKKKDDVKLLPSNPDTEEAEIIVEAPNQPTIFDKDIQIQELLDLIKKIKIQENATDIVKKGILEKFVNKIGFQATKDGLLGMIDTKAQPKTISFFTAENLLKYPNYEETKKEHELSKESQKQKEAELLKKQRTLEELIHLYHRERSKFLKDFYEKLTPEEKAEKHKELFDRTEIKRTYFPDNNVKLINSYGIDKIAETLAYPGGYDEAKNMKYFAEKNYNIKLEFDDRGEAYIL